MANQLNILLEPASITACLETDIPQELKFMGKALQHQVDVFEAAKNHDIILDLAPTGTGKTKAGLSVLFHNLDPNSKIKNAVYIAPTNALIEQQTVAAESFIRQAGLPHIVKAASARHIKEWPSDRISNRPGEKLYNVLLQPATIFPECQDIPILLVTNPDIFYYATFFAYGKLDRSNIASQFYSSFSTVIFDEFHLYDAKQLIGLLFYMTLSHIFGYFKENRKNILLTATPEEACDIALNTLEKNGVKIKRIDGKENSKNLIPSQTPVNLTIRQKPDTKEQLISEISLEVVRRLKEYPDQNGAIILDSKDTLNRISDQLRAKGLENKIGRIIGNTPIDQRQIVAQKQVILATQTVDVGFNFEKNPEPSRQNLDWLIFATRDRFSFWQRLGRVGRVLGKQETEINSEAIAYLPEKAWQEGIEQLDKSGGREALFEMLKHLDCLKRPFLDIYWKSEAFLEIAKPLLELETVLAGLPQENLVINLYQALQAVLNKNKEWNYYRKRIRVIQGAINIFEHSAEKLQKDWQYIKNGQSFVMSFLRANYPEDYESIKNETNSIKVVETMIKKDKELAQELLDYAQILKASYSPLFRFRDSLFKNIKVRDPHYFLLDEIGETSLDPIHLLRYLEFETDGNLLTLIARAEQAYDLTFSLSVEDLEDFNNTMLCKLYAFKNCTIKRSQGGSVRPTEFSESLKEAIQSTLMPGVIVKEHSKNRWAIAKLKKQGLDCYPILVSDYSSSKPTEYTFFPSLSGILAIAAAGVALKCPDNEDFYIV